MNLKAEPVSATKEEREVLEGFFRKCAVLQLQLEDFAAAVSKSNNHTLELGKYKFDLHLESCNIRSDNYQAFHSDGESVTPIEAPPICTYKGNLKKVPHSIVRLTILPNMLQGYIKISDSWIFVDPVRKYCRDVDEERHIVFEQDDVIDQGKTCGASEFETQAETLMSDAPLITECCTGIKQNFALVDTEVGTDADYEYYRIYGANTNSQIEGVINQVRGIYSTEVLAKLVVGFQHVYTSNQQPYTSTNPSELLSQLKSFWNANHGTVSRDVAHLFTGKELDGNTVGIAYRNSVCRTDAAYGLSENHSRIVKVVAHELGHNFGAGHLPPNQCNGSGYLMCSSIQSDGPEEFTDASIVSIGTYIIDKGHCLHRRGWDQLISGGPFSDGQGWHQPQCYSTIQVATVGNDLYMIGRGAAGVYTYKLDEGNAWKNLTSGGPFTNSWGWNEVQYYSTIQIAAVGNDLYMIGRGAVGVQTYRLSESNAWQNLTSSGPFTDGRGWNRPQYYSTIQIAGVGNDLYMIGRGVAGVYAYKLDGSNGWQRLTSGGPFTDDGGWDRLPYYSTIQIADVGNDLYMIGRGAAGVYTYKLDGSNGWQRLTSGGPFSDGHGWDQPQYYSTIQIAAVGNDLYMIGRSATGVYTYKLDGSNGWQKLTSGGPFTNGRGWNKVQYYSTIRLVVVGDSLFLTARGQSGMYTYEWSGQDWLFLSSGNPGLNEWLGWNDVAYYSTIQPTSANGSLSIVARAPGGMYLFQRS